MEPYYADDDVTLYLGDCRDVLPHLESSSVDLLLTDPPYGQDWQSQRRDKLVRFDLLDDDVCTTPRHEALAVRPGRRRVGRVPHRRRARRPALLRCL